MSVEARPAEGAPTPRPRRVASPLRVRAVLAAHADLASNRETFPAAEADQGDLAMLLLVLVDLQHAALELAREQAGVVTKQLVGLHNEVKTLARRAHRAEALLQEVVKQAKAANVTANDQADLLDELAEAFARDGASEREPAAEGEERERDGEHEEGLGDAIREQGEEGEQDSEEDFEEDLDEPEEEDEPEDGDTDHGEGRVPEVVVPDAIIDSPASARGPRPDFDHPRAG